MGPMMPKFAAYRCDGPSCTQVGQLANMEYFGSYPNGWFRILEFRHGSRPVQSNGPCFHSKECMTRWFFETYSSEDKDDDGD